MGLSDKFKKRFRQIALGMALITASVVHGKNNSEVIEKSEKNPITQKEQQDFFQKYFELKLNFDMNEKGSRYTYEKYIIRNYKNIKKQLEQSVRFEEYRFIQTGIYGSSYENALHRQIDFSQDMQNQYQNLIVKQKKGQITETEKKFLSAISAEADLQLNNLLKYAEIYPKNNFKIHQPIYQMIYSIMKQLDYQQQQCYIHPETRLAVAQEIMKYTSPLSEKKEKAVIFPWLTINPNKLHTFMDEVENRVDASDGITVCINHPDKNRQIGFEFNIKQKDLDFATQSAKIVHDYIQNHITNYDVRRELLQMMNDVMIRPTPDLLSSVKDRLLEMAEYYQETFNNRVFDKHLKQATEIPFQLTVRDKGNIRPAVKEDADLFLTVLVDNVHHLDKKGVISLNDIVSKTLGEKSLLLRGLSSIGYFISDIFSDPVRSFLKEPVKEGFEEAILLRDEWNKKSTGLSLKKYFKSSLSPISEREGKTLQKQIVHQSRLSRKIRNDKGR